MATASDPRRVWAEELRSAGFWTVPSADATRTMVERVVAGAAADLTVDDQGWWVDGEDLVEGIVEQLLTTMAPTLGDLGVEISARTIEGPHDQGSTRYAIEINGVRIDLYRTDPADPRLPLSTDPWTDCTILPSLEPDQPTSRRCRSQ